MPLGFSLVGNGILIVRAIGAAIVAEYYDLSSSGAVLKSQYVVNERFASDDRSFVDGVRPVAMGSTIVLQPSRRVLHLDSGSGILSEVQGPEQGHVEALSAISPTLLVGNSADSTQLIDVSDPKSPSIVSGGLLPPAAQPIQLSFSDRAGALPVLGPNRELTASDDQVSLLQQHADSAPTFLRSLAIHGGPALLNQGLRSLVGFKASTAEKSAAVVEFPLDGLRPNSGGSSELRASFEQDLGIAAASAFVDATADQLFVVAPSAGATAALAVHRYQRGDEGRWVAAGEVSLSGTHAQGIAGFGYAALVVDGHQVVLLEARERFRQVAALTVDPSDLLGPPLRLSEQELDISVASPRSGLTVLGVPELNLITNYGLPERALSVEHLGNTVVAATGNRVFALSPKCPLLSDSAECPTPGELKCGSVHEVQSCSGATGKWEPMLSCMDTCQQGKCLSVRSVFMGQLHNCATISDGSIRCWGERDLLGAALPPSTTTTAGPVTVLDEDGSTPLPGEQIALGSRHSCVLGAGGRVKCWGLPLYGALGDGQVTGYFPVQPHPALNADSTPLQGVTGIAAGGHTTCVVMADKTARCFGAGSEGQLGNNLLGPTANRGLAQVVVASGASNSALAGVKQLALGYLHACALLDDGSLRCWGNNELGQLGNHRSGSGSKSALPEIVLDAAGQAPLGGVQALSAGYTHNCALLGDGTAFCWGEGVNGELGHGLASGVTYSDLPLPVLGTDGNPLQDIVSVTAGWGFTCVVLKDSTAKCFGSGRRGERADGVLLDSHVGPEPTVVLGEDLRTISSIVQTAAGYHSLCVRNAQSLLACAGTNLNEFVFGSNSSLPSSVRW